jgi:hypothetical protein
MQAHNCKIWVIYYNPVHYDLFDSCPFLQRYAAENMEYDDEEKTATPFSNTFDPVAIYQSQPFLPAQASAEAQIKVTIPDVGAVVVPASR